MKTLFWLWYWVATSGGLFPAPFQSKEDCELAFAQLNAANIAFSNHRCIAIQSYYP